MIMYTHIINVRIHYTSGLIPCDKLLNFSSIKLQIKSKSFSENIDCFPVTEIRNLST